ncbi:hypothetical protein [Corynebacterium qintianiae]|uniref:hypothetical protein n=1 Tax=Corynebacterium qintianiae TaxID=2709392 RepID=UPI001F1A72D4|nr:hypothetical protein [Corynebacterium qintianiae]
MPTSLTRIAAALSSAFALTASACSFAPEQSGNETPTTTVTTSTFVDTPADSSGESPASAEPKQLVAPAEAPAQAPRGDTASRPGNLNGQDVTVCTAGDGWGVSELAVNAHTSCDFAFNVLGAMAEGVPSTENIRNYLPRTVNAKSPVTGKFYEMYCADNGVGIITCTGGNNAEVILQ